MRQSTFSIITIFIALMLIGAVLLPFQNVSLKPSRNLQSLMVSYNWPDASAVIIEQKVTSKIESVLSSIKGLKEISSVSSKNNGSIYLKFKKESNMDDIRFEVATLIRLIYQKLPGQVSYPEISINRSDNDNQALVIYQISGDKSPFAIKNFANNYIVPKFSNVKGIKDIKIFGATPYEWEVCYNHNKINTLNISVTEIITAIRNYFSKFAIGNGNLYIKGLNYMPKVQVMLKNVIPQNINWEIIPIKKSSNHIIYLGDIAKIQYKEQKPHSYFRINGLNAINIVFYPETQTNKIKLAKKITTKMAILNNNLPQGYTLLKTYNSSEQIIKEIKKISLRALFSLAILFIFVIISTRNIHYLWIIMLSLIATLLIASIFYYILNLEIQLYSLAGITISLGIIIDNSIIMIHHYTQYKNLKVFLSIFAATLTTVASIGIIFFLNENQQTNLLDFAYVLIINLAISLCTAVLFIPALMDKIDINNKKKSKSYKYKRHLVYLNRIYKKSIILSKKYKWIYFAIFILLFGLPINLLPSKIENKTVWAKIYNSTFGSDFYNYNMREKANVMLGGSLRLFTKYVFENAHFESPQRTVLLVEGNMHEGCTVQQINVAIKKMENIISKYNKVDFYQTIINNPHDAKIKIYFKHNSEKSTFPLFLENVLTTEAINIGGINWNIHGIGIGFNNDISTSNFNSNIILEGYNYKQLNKQAQVLKKKLERNNRIKKVSIEGRISWSENSHHEYLIQTNNKLLALYNIPLLSFQQNLQNCIFAKDIMTIYNNNNLQTISLKADIAKKNNIWMLNNKPLIINNKSYNTKTLSKIIKQEKENNIYKKNQQYQLVLNYNFIGTDLLMKKTRKKFVEQTNKILPLGYKCKEPVWNLWNKHESKQYLLIFVIIIIIFFICSILFESLIQPFAIILMIPISFIGVFLTFYYFDINFDQGGFASFILLAGIVVNAGIYLINEYNYQLKQNITPIKAYIKTFNYKITPIFLTIISTVLGLIPFIYTGKHEVFWFAFAAGSIGGLIFSFVAIIIFLPLFLNLKRK